jgi:hypothetical protein
MGIEPVCEVPASEGAGHESGGNLACFCGGKSEWARVRMAFGKHIHAARL